MKKALIAIIIILLLLAVVFGIGYFMGKNAYIVTVHINNSSQKNISAARIEYENGTAVVSDIKKNKNKEIIFFTKSENSYKLNVIFEDNTSLYSEKRHVSPGSKITENVGDEEIVAVL